MFLFNNCMYKNMLTEIGLSKNESEIYLVLLKKGESTVYQISSNSSISRPNVYDILKKLQEKGLVSSIIKNNKKYFSATNPSLLLNILKEKERNLMNILPSLNKLYEEEKNNVVVEIFQGLNGLKVIMEDMLKAKEIIIFNGVDINKLLEQIPNFKLKNFLNEKRKKKIKTKILYSETVKPVKGPLYTYKKIPSSLGILNNVNYWVYNESVIIGIWSAELLFIKIDNVDVASTFKKNLNYLWKNIS